jgi:ssDNA-binding Zn-finger/Zn-ribbon topoisomerase 1
VTYGSGPEAVEGLQDHAEEKVIVRCPHCGNDRPRRVERTTFMQKSVYPFLGYYPWMCGFCKSSFMARKRYRRKSQKKEYLDK